MAHVMTKPNNVKWCTMDFKKEMPEIITVGTPGKKS